MGGMLSSCCGGEDSLDQYDGNMLKSRDSALDERLLHLPNQCNIHQTFELNEDLLRLKEEYKHKYKELLPRSLNIVNAELYRTYDESDGISIMQFNMLADGLSEAYSDIESDKAFLGVDKECLRWTYRGIKICEEITRFNADIVCIQECDQIEFLMRYLEPFGYKYCYHTIVDSPTQKVAKALSKERNQAISLPDFAIVILYKWNKFEINGDIQSIDKRENVQNVSALAVPLKCKNNQDKEVLVITTHLKSKKSQKGEEIRKKQIDLLLNTLIKNKDDAPVILCCDLNGNPKKNKNGYHPLCYNVITNEIGYKSIYRLSNENDAEPEYTTYKMRKHGIDKHTIDYIFVSDDDIWDIVSILSIPKINDNDASRKALIPSFKYPSDHFSLMAQLKWKQ